MELGQPVTLVGEAVYTRMLSALVDARQAGSLLPGPGFRIGDPADSVVNDLHDALYASKIVSYAQGFMLLRAAADEYGWDLDYSSIAAMWRGGCIIRSRFLGEIMNVYRYQPDLENLLLGDYFSDEIAAAEVGWRRTVIRATRAGLPVPAYASALSFYDGFRSERLPANLIQAQRDFFGAHTYERIDQPRGEFFHTRWGGTGGDVASTTYEV
jgi:6-phosphogluconate dehydrogenase